MSINKFQEYEKGKQHGGRNDKDYALVNNATPPCMREVYFHSQYRVVQN